MKIEVEVKIPTVPNFLMVGITSKSIKDFSDDQLRTIGAEWVEELLRKARVLRCEPVGPIIRRPPVRCGDTFSKEDR